MLNESDTRAKLVDPQLHRTGWQEEKISRERYITDGRVYLVGEQTKRKERKKPDYILLYKPSFPIAVVEAKDESHSPLAGLQQAKEYAEMLDVQFAYSTNGQGIEEFDFTTNKQATLRQFPSPDELWRRYWISKSPSGYKKAAEARDLFGNPLLYPYYLEPGGKIPRYYQDVAIKRVIEAILDHKKRILLTMATGTGKTYVAFQVVWKLVKSKYRHRVLYIADRNFLKEQAHNDEFYPFGDARIYIEEGKTPKTRAIYFSIYQALYSERNGRRLYQEYPPDFFDLIIIDECHRSGFGTWHEILKHFQSAIHLGMTATPKRTDNIDTYAYFGEPVYSYSFAQGVSDGFLAPFQLFRTFTNIDKDDLHLQEAIYQGAQIYIPEEAEPRVIYTMQDFGREIIVPDRTRILCEHLAHQLQTFGPTQRSIIYCATIDHAAEVAKELQNHFSYLGYSDYAVRIVAEEPDVDKIYERFKDSERPTPVVATTVDLLTTGVDIPSVHNIVLLKPIASKVVFKQIIGRGSRIDPSSGKYFFRIIDYVNATRLLDGWEVPLEGKPKKTLEGPFNLSLKGMVVEYEAMIPISNAKVIAEIGPNVQRRARTNKEGEFTLTELPHSPVTLFFSANGFRSRQLPITPEVGSPPLVIELKRKGPKAEKIVIHNLEVHIEEETRLVYTADGKKLTEAEYIEYSKKGVIQRAASLEDLKAIWLDKEARHSFLQELREETIYPELIALFLKMPNVDTFDLFAHIAFDAPILSRDQRAQGVINLHQSFLNSFGSEAREVLLALLGKYRIGGIEELRAEAFRIPPFDRMGYGPGVIRRFGGSAKLSQALEGLQERIYEVGK